MRRGLPVLLTAALLAAASSACAPKHDSMSRPAATSPAATSSAVVPSPAAASPSAVKGAAREEGITGQTVVVNCPVDRGDPCPGTPVQARLVVVNGAGRTVATVDTDGQGRFSVALPAGAYTLRPVLVGGEAARRPTGLAVTVGTGRYTTVTMRLDNGLR